MTSYHDTPHVDRDERDEREARAQRQEEAVLRHLRAVRIPQSAEQVHEQILRDAPLTSVRRALTNLQTAGFVEKAGQVQGRFGHKIFRWALVQPMPATTRDWIAEGAPHA